MFSKDLLLHREGPYIKNISEVIWSPPGFSGTNRFFVCLYPDLPLIHPVTIETLWHKLTAYPATWPDTCWSVWWDSSQNIVKKGTHRLFKVENEQNCCLYSEIESLLPWISFIRSLANCEGRGANARFDADYGHCLLTEWAVPLGIIEPICRTLATIWEAKSPTEHGSYCAFISE